MVQHVRAGISKLPSSFHRSHITLLGILLQVLKSGTPQSGTANVVILKFDR